MSGNEWNFNPHSEENADNMKRLTYPGDYCKDIAYCSNECSTGCRNRQLWERLKAYEDTGLTPEKIRRLCNGNSREL